MASGKKVKYEVRKVSKDRWGLFISKTEICYGVSSGIAARKNVKDLLIGLIK